MKYVKPLSVALMTLGLSAPVLADNILSVPSQHGGLKVSMNNMYLTKSDINVGSDSSNDWGFYAQVGYLFPATGNDLTLIYTYAHFDDVDALNVDALDLEVGQRLTSGQADLRLFTGLRYANLDYSFDSMFLNSPQTTTSKLNGMGLRFGMDGRYQLGNSFGLDAHFNTALLASTIKSSYSNEKALMTEEIDRIIPTTEVKLGLDYTHISDSHSKSALVFEVGYQTTHYFNAIRNNAANSSTDASFDGAYLEVKYYA